MSAGEEPLTCDVAVIGGGPGGSTTAAFLAKAGLRVTLFERERFPRFRVGESLLPATLGVLDRLGLREVFDKRGYLLKHGAYFHDQESGYAHTFYFLKGRPWPSYAYQVPRADFDAILLEHARAQGVTVFQPATVAAVLLDADGASLSATAEGGVLSVRARFVVDASGRDAFLPSRIGQRRRVPNLGKVALFAHFRGADRAPGIDEGNIRVYVFEDGWCWWIPFAGDLTSIGCVLHAKTVKGRDGNVESLYHEMLDRCREVARGLARAERVTPVHRVANFSYVNRPIAGDRFVCVGDAVAFVDPIFSGGVYIAMQSGETAAKEIARAFADGRFRARRFRGYERTVWRGLRPFWKLIDRYYQPAFLELFLNPRNWFGGVDAVLTVLSGGGFLGMRPRQRLALAAVFGLARINSVVRRVRGQTVESRLEW